MSELRGVMFEDEKNKEAYNQSRKDAIKKLKELMSSDKGADFSFYYYKIEPIVYYSKNDEENENIVFEDMVHDDSERALDILQEKIIEAMMFGGFTDTSTARSVAKRLGIAIDYKTISTFWDEKSKLKIKKDIDGLVGAGDFIKAYRIAEIMGADEMSKEIAGSWLEASHTTLQILDDPKERREFLRVWMDEYRVLGKLVSEDERILELKREYVCSEIEELYRGKTKETKLRDAFYESLKLLEAVPDIRASSIPVEHFDKIKSRVPKELDILAKTAKDNPWSKDAQNGGPKLIEKMIGLGIMDMENEDDFEIIDHVTSGKWPKAKDYEEDDRLYPL